MHAMKQKLLPADLKDVEINDAFWTPRAGTNRRVTLPGQYKHLEDTGRIDALRLQWRPGAANRPHPFWDSDVAKWLEAAAYALATRRDRKLEALADRVIDRIAGAQQPDGYLNSYFAAVEPDSRWKNLRDMHELYCAGHLMEAGVAYFEATRKRKLLDVTCRLADHINNVFGRRKGRKRGYPGHEEIELALVKLYRATDQKRYLELASYFVDERGRTPHYFAREARARGEDPGKTVRGREQYWQAHAPVREQDEAVGHAVRAGYLYSGMADVAAETGDEELLAACKRLWASITQRKMYVTGGVGSRHAGESFGADYELPNDTAYAETCAAIALVFFAHRMLQVDPDRKYADGMELALYNAALAGVSADGRRSFYVNPLASDGAHHRREWFDCACCPPNLARLIASLGRYVYSAGDRSIYVHLYVGGRLRTELAGRQVTLAQRTRYPWDGEVKIAVRLSDPAKFALMLRIPGWCRRYVLKVNGGRARHRVVKGYAKVAREWRDGDVVELSLAMPVERVAAHPSVAADAGKVALRRGPIVYCLEQCDHAADVRSVALPDRAKLAARFDRRLLGGAVVIEAQGVAPRSAGWKGALYRTGGKMRMKPVKIQAVPYYLWDNRAPGPMTVWIPRA